MGKKVTKGGNCQFMADPIRIFIADGTRDGADLLRRALEPEPELSVVGVALSGDEALRRFPESGADVLLCDLLLPRLDGLSLLIRLKEAQLLRHAIVLSAFYNDRIARQVSPLADAFLPKPCSAADLVRHIRMCADGGRSACPDQSAIRLALFAAGVMPHLDGFRYLHSALERTLRDPGLLRGVTKSLYRDIAKEFGTTPACVERSMRAAIERAWERMDIPARTRLFGQQAADWTKAPSNVPFLTAMTVLLDTQAGELREKEACLSK